MARLAPNGDDAASDPADLRAAAAGDRRAAARLYDRYGPMIYRIGLSMLRAPAPAEDLVQDTFLRLWRKIDGLVADQVPVRAWLIRVASNRCVDMLRKHGEVSDDGIAEPADRAAGPHENLAGAQLGHEIDKAMARLTEGQQLAITLTAKLGFSTREAAAAMGMGERAVESLVARAKRALRQTLAAVADDYIER
ncbi:MAG: sigma-70 family RNA polymerase sigma factor [Pseudomonadota bacterium]